MNNENIPENIIKIFAEFYNKHFDGVVEGITATFIMGVFGWMIGVVLIIYTYKKYKNTVQDVGFQTYIFGEVSYVVCNSDNYKIANIPEILLNFKKRLHISKNKQDNDNEIYFWRTRISTFIAFTDGKRILLFDRKDNPKKESIHNPKMDVYGAVAFHNNSLEYKIPSRFMLSKIVNMHSIPGIVIEENKVNLRKFIKNIFTHETAIMMGFIAYIAPNDLDKGLEIDVVDKIEKNDNILLPISCLNVDDANLTAKAQLAIKYLKAQEEIINCDEVCKEYCDKKPLLYTTEQDIKKDDLTRINGIGEKIQEKLYHLGIYKFEQIANWTDDNIEWIQEYLYFPDRVKRERWVEQARKIL